MSNILYIESDMQTYSFVKYLLEWHGHNIQIACNENEIYKLFMQTRPDIILARAQSLQSNDCSIFNQIRMYNCHLPILLVASKTERVILFAEIGKVITDYICEEYLLEEIELRIRFALAKVKNSQPQYQFILSKDSIFDYLGSILKTCGKIIKLTRIEATILLELSTNMNNIVTREVLVGRCWQNNYEENYRYLDHYMVNIRKYLHDDPCITINTIRGSGYTLLSD